MALSRYFLLQERPRGISRQRAQIAASCLVPALLIMQQASRPPDTDSGGEVVVPAQRRRTLVRKSSTHCEFASTIGSSPGSFAFNSFHAMKENRLSPLGSFWLAEKAAKLFQNFSIRA